MVISSRHTGAWARKTGIFLQSLLPIKRHAIFSTPATRVTLSAPSTHPPIHPLALHTRHWPIASPFLKCLCLLFRLKIIKYIEPWPSDDCETSFPPISHTCPPSPISNPSPHQVCLPAMRGFLSPVPLRPCRSFLLYGCLSYNPLHPFLGLMDGGKLRALIV